MFKGSRDLLSGCLNCVAAENRCKCLNGCLYTNWDKHEHSIVPNI